MTTTADLRECAGAIESTFLQNDQIRKDYGGLLRKAAADLHFAADELDKQDTDAQAAIKEAAERAEERCVDIVRKFDFGPSRLNQCRKNQLIDILRARGKG